MYSWTVRQHASTAGSVCNREICVRDWRCLFSFARLLVPWFRQGYSEKKKARCVQLYANVCVMVMATGHGALPQLRVVSFAKRSRDRALLSRDAVLWRVKQCVIGTMRDVCSVRGNIVTHVGSSAWAHCPASQLPLLTRIVALSSSGQLCN